MNPLAQGLGDCRQIGYAAAVLRLDGRSETRQTPAESHSAHPMARRCFAMPLQRFFAGFGVPTPSPRRKSVRALRLPSDQRPSRPLSLAGSDRAPCRPGTSWPMLRGLGVRQPRHAWIATRASTALGWCQGDVALHWTPSSQGLPSPWQSRRALARDSMAVQSNSLQNIGRDC